MGITASGEDGETESRFSSCLKIYEKTVFKAPAIRHQCILILERWENKGMSKVLPALLL